MLSLSCFLSGPSTSPTQVQTVSRGTLPRGCWPVAMMSLENHRCYIPLYPGPACSSSQQEESSKPVPWGFPLSGLLLQPSNLRSSFALKILIFSPLVEETGSAGRHICSSASFFRHDCSSYNKEVQDWTLLKICLPDNSITCESLAGPFYDLKALSPRECLMKQDCVIAQSLRGRGDFSLMPYLCIPAGSVGVMYPCIGTEDSEMQRRQELL